MGDLQLEVFTILELINDTNNGKLLNCRLTMSQRLLMPYMRKHGWIRNSYFLTEYTDFPDSHIITPVGRKLLEEGES